MRRIPTARIVSGCIIGAGPVYRKGTIIRYIRSRLFMRPSPSVLPRLAVGIPRDADRCFFRPLAFRMTGWRSFCIARDDTPGAEVQRYVLSIAGSFFLTAETPACSIKTCYPAPNPSLISRSPRGCHPERRSVPALIEPEPA